MNRRRFIKSFGALSIGAVALGAYSYWPEQGFINPCKSALPPELANHELLRLAWEGLDAQQVWDSHTHLTGLGDSESGIWVNPNMDRWLNPVQYVQKLFFLNAGCVDQTEGQVDESYVERMCELVKSMPRGFKVLLYAFDYFHAETGEKSLSRSTFHVPNEYAAHIAARYPDCFEWAASIHPYREDWREQIQFAREHKARAVKWLPAAMGMNPGSAKCDPFYAALAQYDIPLITHAGLERAVHGGDTQHYGNPLLLRRPLEQGVRVVVAHCASMGQDLDFDRGKNAPLAASFDLFARLMGDRAYEGKLFGDISAVTQINRAAYIPLILQNSDWHARLLNGSDYPLPGVMPLFALDYLVELKLLDASAVEVLTQIRHYNPLMFDFVLKRLLRTNESGFPNSVFETRRFFKGATNGAA